MHLLTRSKLKSEKGNAMILSLSVILILMAFGTVSLMTSVANVKMGAQYKNWSKDYYALDVNAEGKVNDIDSLLESAESKAQNYMSGQYYSQAETPSGDLQITDPAQIYLNDQWQQLVGPYLTEMSSQTYKDNQSLFMQDSLKRLYYYYASDLLQKKGYTLVTSVNGSVKLLSDYQGALFETDPLVLADGNLSVELNSDTVNGKTVAVKLNVLFPTYTTLPQTKTVKFQGNPIWTNAITASGSIGFLGQGLFTINGDITSADQEETIPINDNVVQNSGVYSDGAQVLINGNVYSKGNLHIIGSNINQKASITVHGYPSGFSTILKNNVFSGNNLFFDKAAVDNFNTANESKNTTADDFIEGLMTDRNSSNTNVPLVYQDTTGGNVYCNSLSVDDSADSGTIQVAGIVNTFDDIQMDGQNSSITVSGNYIGVNSVALNGDPNATSAVINNASGTTAGTGSTIRLIGKFIVPGTAFAEFTGVKAYNATNFTWAGNQLYYQTGESITAQSDDIFGAYLASVANQLPSYNYVYDQYTTDPVPQNPQTVDEKTINSFYLMRGTALDNPYSDILDPKISQLIDFLKGKSVVSNVYDGPKTGSTVPEGYSLGAAILHPGSSSTATVFAPPQDSQDSITNYTNNMLAYDTFKDCLKTIFVSKTQKLGTTDKWANDFEGTWNSLTQSYDNAFVDKSVVLDDQGNLRAGIETDPSAKPDSFVYMPNPDETYNLNGNDSGVIYCAGNLKITGTGTFSGAIICKGNVTLSGSPTITYDESVIQKVLVADGKARVFFAPGAMGTATEIQPYSTSTVDGGTRTGTAVKRYEIVEWKEEQH